MRRNEIITGSPSYPLVSIIMPTYNRAGFIAESINSVRSQTYSNWELIIIDDGSNDDTENIVSRIADERIIFYKAGRIAMPGKIKNIGIEKAKGDLIAFMDSDDLWAEDKLEKQVRALERSDNAGFCITGGFNFTEPGKPVEYFNVKPVREFTGSLFIPFFNSEWTAFAQALLVRKSCLDKIEGFPENDNFSDVEFIVNLAFHFPGILVYEPLLHRRIHPSGYSSAEWEKGYDQGIGMIKNFRNKKMLSSKLADHAFFKLYINFGEKYLAKGNRKKAIGQFARAWMHKPVSIVPVKKILKSVFAFNQRAGKVR